MMRYKERYIENQNIHLSKTSFLNIYESIMCIRICIFESPSANNTVRLQRVFLNAVLKHSKTSVNKSKQLAKDQCCLQI